MLAVVLNLLPYMIYSLRSVVDFKSTETRINIQICMCFKVILIIMTSACSFVGAIAMQLVVPTFVLL